MSDLSLLLEAQMRRVEQYMRQHPLIKPELPAGGFLFGVNKGHWVGSLSVHG